MVTAKGNRKRLSSTERRTQTLERVTQTFASKGFAGTTSAELARAAGISEALLYKLFGSKKGLYQAMLQHKLDTAGWGEFPVDVGAETPVDVFFEGITRSVFSKVENDPDFARLLLFSDLQGSEFAELFHVAQGSSIVAAVVDYLRQCAADGAIREIDPQAVAMTFLCMAWQTALAVKLFRSDHIPQCTDEVLIRTMVDVFSRGLTP